MSAPRSGATQYREPTLPNELRDQLRALGEEVYFVRNLAFRELFKIAWPKVRFHRGSAAADAPGSG